VECGYAGGDCFAEYVDSKRTELVAEYLTAIIIGGQMYA